MEQVVSKPNIFSPRSIAANGNHSHHHHGVSFFPNKSAVFSCASASPFPLLKLRSAVFSCASASPFPLLKLRSSPLKSSSSWSSSSNSYGRCLVLGGKPSSTIPQYAASGAQMSIGIGKAQRWWEKGLQPNMKSVTGAQDLVDSLSNAADKLVVVDFFSPGCGGCKALHPKICQLAEINPDVQFLQVNYEGHKSMCYTLNVHVLPFFRFYRGDRGRVCSFSCTNTTIKKFKDALAKYGADTCILGPAKGLEEKELLALAANRDLSFNYTPKTEPHVAVPVEKEILTEAVEATPCLNPGPPLPLPCPLPSAASVDGTVNTEKRSLVSSRR